MVPRIFVNLILIQLSFAAIVKWMPNKSFNLAINFKDAKLPCPKQTVVFPDNTVEAVKIDHNIAVGGLVLPKNGEIVIDGELGFGGVVIESDKCLEEKNAYYTPRSQSTWNQADVWSSDKFNKATPDAERLPCFDDEVEFPDTEFTAILPYIEQSISSLKLGSEQASLMDPKTNTYQVFVPNKFGTTGVEVKKQQQCNARAGCLCQRNTLKIDCSTKLCAKPKCVDPVKPIGHCCKICGGFMILDIDETFNFMQFKENVGNIVDSYGEDSLDYHVGRIPGDKVQVVVVPKEKYTGTSAYVVHMIEYETGHFGVNSLASISGSPLSKADLGWKIFFSMFFAVALVMAAVYFYYYKLPEMSEISFPNLNRGRRGVVSHLTRFNRRTDSVVSLTRRDSAATISPGTPILGEGTSFRNPMYDSRRGRVQIVDPVPEEDVDSLKDKVY